MLGCYAKTYPVVGSPSALNQCISVELYRSLAQAFRTGRNELLQQLSCELLNLGSCTLFSYKTGGADGIRTHYLLTASQTLSRLSYSPAWFKNITKQLGKLKLNVQAQPL
jgi:hypothetical protein